MDFPTGHFHLHSCPSLDDATRCSGSSNWIKKDPKIAKFSLPHLPCPPPRSALHFPSLCTHPNTALPCARVLEIQSQIFIGQCPRWCCKQKDGLQCVLSPAGPAQPSLGHSALILLGNPAWKTQKFPAPKRALLCSKFSSDSVLYPAATLGPRTWDLMAFMMVLNRNS